jgi:hypothetical protein
MATKDPTESARGKRKPRTLWAPLNPKTDGRLTNVYGEFFCGEPALVGRWPWCYTTARRPKGWWVRIHWRRRAGRIQSVHSVRCRKHGPQPKAVLANRLVDAMIPALALIVVALFATITYGVLKP